MGDTPGCSSLGAAAARKSLYSNAHTGHGLPGPECITAHIQQHLRKPSALIQGMYACVYGPLPYLLLVFARADPVGALVPRRSWPLNSVGDVGSCTP